MATSDNSSSWDIKISAAISLVTLIPWRRISLILCVWRAFSKALKSAKYVYIYL